MKHRQSDYESLTAEEFSRSWESESDRHSLSGKRTRSTPEDEEQGLTNPTWRDSQTDANATVETSSRDDSQAKSNRLEKQDRLPFSQGHTITYAGLFLFTLILYLRPGEFYPSPLTQSIAFIVGLITVAIFLPTQFSLEGNFSARPREINLVLLLTLTALLSIPLALSPAEAWAAFSNIFIRCVIIFIIIVNVVRTEARLKGLLFLAVAVGLMLGIGAINDYRLGLATVEGYRVGGRGSGIFGNSNDMALHLVTLVPIVVSLSFATRSILKKLIYYVCAAILVAGIVTSYSRGAFIGLVVAAGILGWKLGQERRFAVAAVAVIIAGLFLVVMPGNYGIRILSIFVPSLDPVGSFDARRAEFLRSLNVAIHNPLLGVGMNNYASQMSYRELGTHNSYTQVAAELGLAGFVCYTLFVVAPFRRLGQIAKETFATRSSSRYYYLAVGLQASLGAYMVSSFFASVAYYWYVYYLVGYAVCFRRIYEADQQTVELNDRKSKETKRVRSLVPSVAEPGN